MIDKKVVLSTQTALTMPYAVKQIGIYKIVNNVTKVSYVGQSRNVKKRVANHFNLLKRRQHPNQKLQNSYNKYGEEAFSWELEVLCEDGADLDNLENAFLRGDASFLEPNTLNIATEAQAAMLGKRHSAASKELMAEGRRRNAHKYQTEEYRTNLSLARQKAALANPEHLAKVKFIVDNPSMSYAARGREIGMDTSRVRRIALKYSHLRGKI